jgi:hypothetical protein
MTPVVRDTAVPQHPALARPEEPEELDRCECGQLLATHPPLANPKPLDHGRPCGRSSTYNRKEATRK